MKKVFEKYGMLKCIGTIMDIIGIILLVVAIPVSNGSAEAILRLIGVFMLLLGTYGIFYRNFQEKLTKAGLFGTLLILLSFILIAVAVFIDETDQSLVNADMTVKLVSLANSKNCFKSF